MSEQTPTVSHQTFSGEDVVVVEVEALGVRNAVYIRPYQADVCLQEWYGRNPLDETTAGIDTLIALLQAAKQEIAKIQSANVRN